VKDRAGGFNLPSEQAWGRGTLVSPQCPRLLRKVRRRPTAVERMVTRLPSQVKKARVLFVSAVVDE
jgi:hypothetical protein